MCEGGTDDLHASPAALVPPAINFIFRSEGRSLTLHAATQTGNTTNQSMSWSSSHFKWLVDTGERLETSDGKLVEVWEFRHEQEAGILSAWARHFRNHYCLDIEIDSLRSGYRYSRSKYLNQIKFPDPILAPGPSVSLPRLQQPLTDFRVHSSGLLSLRGNVATAMD